MKTKMYDFERQLFESMSMKKRKKLAKQLELINRIIGFKDPEVKYK